MADGKNRREGFRMDDVAKLKVTIPDPDESDGILAGFNSYRLRTCLRSHLRNQTQSRLPKLQAIRKRDPEIADYLKHLETQIVQLAAQLSNDSAQTVNDSHQDTLVNLSSKGLRFTCALALEPGQILELDMMLSSGAHLVALAEVLRIEEDESNGEGAGSMNQVSTRFTQIHPDDSEVIIRHLARLQQLELQARRAG